MVGVVNPLPYTGKTRGRNGYVPWLPVGDTQLLKLSLSYDRGVERQLTEGGNVWLQK